MLFSSRFSRLELALFNFQDVCVYIQEDLSSHLRTAALDLSPGIEATFRWLQKRGISVGLISRFDQPTTALLMQRLNWTMGKGQIIQLVVYDLEESTNPIERGMEQAGIKAGSGILTLVDTPRLLKMANDCQVYLNLGTTNGSHPYHVLRNAPHFALLDQPLQLAEFLLTHLPQEGDLGTMNLSPDLFLGPGGLPVQ